MPGVSRSSARDSGHFLSEVRRHDIAGGTVLAHVKECPSVQGLKPTAVTKGTNWHSSSFVEAAARVRDSDQGIVTFRLASITLFGGMLGTACPLERASDEDWPRKRVKTRQCEKPLASVVLDAACMQPALQNKQFTTLIDNDTHGLNEMKRESWGHGQGTNAVCRECKTQERGGNIV